MAESLRSKPSGFRQRNNMKRWLRRFLKSLMERGMAHRLSNGRKPAVKALRLPAKE
jgi:hypothetical protein